MLMQVSLRGLSMQLLQRKEKSAVMHAIFFPPCRQKKDMHNGSQSTCCLMRDLTGSMCMEVR
jgi:hypothetical protein